jgi:hypothetical protein
MAQDVTVTLPGTEYDHAREHGLKVAQGAVWARMERTRQIRRRGRGVRVTFTLTVRQAEALRRWYLDHGVVIGGEHNLAFDAAERITLALSDVLI